MSNFAIEGLISGFDTTALIDAILDIQVRGPISQIERRVEGEQQKLGSFQTLNANVLGLDVTSQGLRSTALFDTKSANSSNESILSASANSSASKGAFQVRVDNLAKADQVSSDIFLDANEEMGFSGDFLINGQKISVSASDTLQTISTQINASGSGANASVIQTAANQTKLVISAADTGVNRLEFRQVGTSSILDDLGLIGSGASVDYTVNADNNGALSDLFDPLTDTFDFTGKSITINDSGGQFALDVNFSGVLDLTGVASEINAASQTAGANISATVVTEGSEERLQISSATGIPSNFNDPDNVLFDLGIVGGVQSEDFTSSVLSVADILDLEGSTDSTFRITNGDGSTFIDVTVNFGTDSLVDIADKINTAATPPPPGSDISAQVITVGGISRLEISSASGNAIFSNDANNALSTLGVIDSDFKNYDQQGEDAQFTYNGITVNRKSNIVTDLVEGISIAMKEESSSFVTISVNEDYSQVENTVQSFVDSFNTVMGFIDEQTVFDPDGANGILFGNDTVRRLSNSLANSISSFIPNLPGLSLSKLNEGAGIDLGKIKITDRSGASAEINLNDARTVQDVLDAINLNEDIKVKASINQAGDSINLSDESGGFLKFSVEEVDGTTAADLGLLRQVSTNRIAGGIIGAGAGRTSLASIGIELSATGELTFDTTKLSQALNDNPELVKNLFTASKVGFGNVFQDSLKTFTAFGTGILDSAEKAIVDNIERQIVRIEGIEERAAIQEQVLRKRFTALEVTLSQSQQITQTLTQAFSSGR
ncbi:MAG: flagellar filament capping protein FliD [Candidatus Hinthialibacter antarcticus]|nr:flagellar filament capping protein FliD [Candidatus Hinthialibacter antarcticus]